ncbi:MAG: hypothetical protein H2172_08330 [Opitutus sp.]|nr:hypothetical protein [Opitutus sp.]MCS6246587.1 hypothetical protein [Opitutus sp.]MCS6272729.1 hypothetical protein [Opitutus sp.]MCS6276360.1 hypothetical protein [Opitutus sp.]MCS6301992.1 hypothetical protein [Opitutus sp.]
MSSFFAVAFRVTPWLGLALALSVTASAETTRLYAENFDAVPAQEALYPPPTGTTFTSLLDGRFNAWSKGGVIQIAVRPGAGEKGGVALLITPVEGSDQVEFYSVTAGPIVFLEHTGASLRAGDLWALRLAFAIRVPTGQSVQCLLGWAMPSGFEELEARAYLELPETTGSGRFEKYAVRGDQLPAKAIDEFIAVARTLQGRRLRLKIEWRIAAPSAWTPGDSISLDDLTLGAER